MQNRGVNNTVAEVPFGTNEIRLSPRQWVAVSIIVAVTFLGVPLLWRQTEPLVLTEDYRIPFSLGNDYWLYERYCDEECGTDKILVLGDSVVWGHYVPSEQTLSHYLNLKAEKNGLPYHFTNIGIDGIHPVAMAGLVEYYGKQITGKKLVLLLNLLWMSSPEQDLQTEKDLRINHSRLIPQFSPRIACYREPLAGKLGVVVGRNVDFLAWTDHFRFVSFQGNDFPHWTLEHPYENPAAAVTMRLPSPDEPPSPLPVAKPWTDQKIAKYNASWVELDSSVQWKAFQRTVNILRQRGNQVFVLVNPFNEHMLKEKSQIIYNQRKGQVEAWLQAQKIPYYIPPALPSHFYADASHPLNEGYKMLADALSDQNMFRETCGNKGL